MNCIQRHCVGLIIFLWVYVSHTPLRLRMRWPGRRSISWPKFTSETFFFRQCLGYNYNYVATIICPCYQHNDYTQHINALMHASCAILATWHTSADAYMLHSASGRVKAGGIDTRDGYQGKLLHVSLDAENLATFTVALASKKELWSKFATTNTVTFRLDCWSSGSSTDR